MTDEDGDIPETEELPASMPDMRIVTIMWDADENEFTVTFNRKNPYEALGLLRAAVLQLEEGSLYDFDLDDDEDALFFDVDDLDEDDYDDDSD